MWIQRHMYTKSPVVAELDGPLLFYVEVLGFERLEVTVSLHDMAA